MNFFLLFSPSLHREYQYVFHSRARKHVFLCQNNAFPFILFTLVVMPRLAPWSSSAAAMSRCPSLAAKCSGVYPELVVASGHAPLPSSWWTMSGLPRRLEICSGVWSSWRQQNGAKKTNVNNRLLILENPQKKTYCKVTGCYPWGGKPTQHRGITLFPADFLLSIIITDFELCRPLILFFLLLWFWSPPAPEANIWLFSC